MSVTERIRTDKNGRRVTRYESEVFVRGERYASQSFKTKASAYAWHDETKKKGASGVDDPGSTLTLGETLSAYQETAFRELRKSSQQSRESRFRYLAESPLAKMLTRDLSPKHIDDWLKWLKGQPTSALVKRQTFLQELKLLSVTLNWYRNEYDHKFTVPIVKRHYKAAFFKPIPVRQQDYYMKANEVIPWLNELKARPDPVYQRFALLMVLTGLRMGEAAGLCWDAIELAEGDSGLIRVIKTLSWDYKTKQPYFQNEAKNDGSIRTVPIIGPVVTMLKEMKKSENQVNSASPIFKTNKGKLLRDNSIRDNFNKAFAACSQNWSGTHIARHTFATMALIAERDLGAVQAALGHTNQRVTAGYAKIVALQSSKVTDNVARMVGLRG